MSSRNLSFKLDVFEGPLDLLLHLISKHKLNINDIEISLLLEQYLSFIENLNELNIEVAAEFLEMAARLIYIKTISLLPKHDEAEELKRELQGSLIEYSICKKASKLLHTKYVGDTIFVRNPIEIQVDSTYLVIHEPTELVFFYSGLSKRALDKAPPDFNSFSTIVSKKIVSVTTKIVFILRKLYATGNCKIDTIFKGVVDKSERVATFLAVLELTKSGRIELNDDNTEIYFSHNKGNEQREIVT